MSGWGGLGVPQRRWILARDNGQCQHFSYKRGKWVQCPQKDPTKLHVHHILPRRFMSAHMPWVDPHRPYNLLTLCIDHHNGKYGVHPDMDDALYDYRGGNKDAFIERFKARRVLVDKGDIYWDTKFDWQYVRRARKNTIRFSRGNPYPEKRRKPDWKRPQKPSKK